MFGLFRKKKEKMGLFVYLSEFILFYNIKMEKVIVGIICEKFNIDNIFVFLKYGMRDISKYIFKVSYFVVIVFFGKFIFLVGREVRIVFENGVKVYIFLIVWEGDEFVYLWVEGVLEDVEWFLFEEIMEFIKSFLNSEFMDIFKYGFVFGLRKREW